MDVRSKALREAWEDKMLKHVPETEKDRIKDWYGWRPFDLENANLQKGNYIKWRSKHLRRACEGKYMGITGDGKVIVSWLWANGGKWVSASIDPKWVIDYQERKWNGYSC